MKQQNLHKIQSKIWDWEQAKQQVISWKQTGAKIVFTNGCFDILHYGHISYLSRAKDLGDYLIIGLNSKQSVQKIKGNHRPINDNNTRSYLLASLFFVDAIIFFEEETPLKLIQLLQPNILVKGGDYIAENIVGYQEVIQGGGTVKVIPFVDGYSTTKIENKIKGIE